MTFWPDVLVFDLEEMMAYVDVNFTVKNIGVKSHFHKCSQPQHIHAAVLLSYHSARCAYTYTYVYTII